MIVVVVVVWCGECEPCVRRGRRTSNFIAAADKPDAPSRKQGCVEIRVGTHIAPVGRADERNEA